MATIVTRSGKGSALTHTEMDANFTNLNTDKLENVSEDATPQLGGDLDLNNNNITGTGNIPAGNLTGTLPAIDGSNLTGVGGGKVLQVVEAETSTPASTTSSTFSDTGLSATITPSSTSSKILILIVQNFSQFNDATGAFRIVRNTTDLRTWGYACGYNTGGNDMPYVPIHYLDSPSTTSAVTYKTTFARTGGSGTLHANYSDGGGDTHSYIHLIEIGV